jgi:hypothetical protein
MRPTFLLNPDFKPVSAIANKSQPHTLRVGLMFLLTRDFLTPWGCVPSGAKGSVTYVDEDMGYVVITMDDAHPALYLWDNELILNPFTTDDLAEELVCLMRPCSTFIRDPEPLEVVSQLRMVYQLTPIVPCAQ